MKFFNALLLAGFLGLGIAAETLATQANKETCDMKTCTKAACNMGDGSCNMPCCQK